MLGYAGRILYVDLTEEKTTVNNTQLEDARKYVGGIGYAIRLLYQNVNPNVDAMSPQNVLMLATGPTSGTMAPTGCGHVFAAKSPLSGGLGISVAFSFLGGEMKRAGFDAIVIKGKAKKPVYLWIDDDSVEFMPCSDLWGKSPTRTEETIHKNLSDASIRVAAIGLAGERLSRIAGITTDQTAIAGRSGMGAVMGSKSLKAIAIRGSHSVQVADPEGLLKFCREFYILARGSAASRHYENDGNVYTTVKDRAWTQMYEPTAKYRELGTTEDILTHNRLGCLPTRNFNASTFEGAEKVSGERLNQHYVATVQACSSCSINCEHVSLVQEGPYKDAVASMDYGSVWAFGPNCGVDRLDAIIKATELCTDYGLDPVSTGNAISFAFDCYERGILAPEDIGGMDLRFGNYQTMLALIPMIGTREDLGDILAEGVKRAAERIGKGAEQLAMHVKGFEMTGHDPRCMKSAALGLAVSFQGADDDRNGGLILDLRERANRFVAEKGKGGIVKDTEDLYVVMDSLMICRHMISAYQGFVDFARLYNLITGFKTTAEELRIAGERINNLARIFNVREGFLREDDHLPARVTTIPIADGASKGNIITQEELDLMLEDYYSARGWNREGQPTEKKLKQLEIEMI